MYELPLFFWFDIFLQARAEILEKISLFFGPNDGTKKHFEINWPLSNAKRLLIIESGLLLCHDNNDSTFYCLLRYQFLLCTYIRPEWTLCQSKNWYISDISCRFLNTNNFFQSIFQIPMIVLTYVLKLRNLQEQVDIAFC